MGRRWYRVLDMDGSTWCETSDPGEVCEALLAVGPDGRAEVCEIVTTMTSWRPWRPETSSAPQ
jgi:hypothetical protein